MTPLSTVLPPPSPTWDLVYQWPANWGEHFPGDSMLPFDRNGALRPGPGHQGLVTGDEVSNNLAYRPFGSDVNEYAVRHGRPCGLWQQATADIGGAGILLPSWFPAFGGGFGAGAVASTSAVAVLDFHLSLEFAAGGTPGWADDSAPIGFVPYCELLAWAGTAFPGGGTSEVGGFGVFCNDVGGSPEYQWVSWTTGGGILERVALAVADVTDWNTFRFIIVTATPGNPATVALEINGTPELTREFGTSVLETPNQMASGSTPPLASTLIPSGTTAGPDSDSVFFALTARWGRFTPAGVEVVS